ncbi:MAG: SAM-dependent chlorinase/fluorinase [Gammaproteobacteria bacterium]|nr:SAM-dependent chlorinase/fluorinase [Gammaproteobacteria bacterium]
MPAVITLTTDFGLKGPFVGVMKGAILARCPDARIVDLTHEIPVHWPIEAGFWLARSYHYFPAGTVHVAVVDPGVGTARSIIAAEHAGHRFLGPDNGLLTPVLGGAPARCHRLSETWRQQQGWPSPSSTFHGRDIFAPLAAELAAGRLGISDIGPPAGELIPSLEDEPQAGAHEVQGTVVAIDNFGNLITNIDAGMIAGYRRAEVLAGGRRLPLRRTYGDVPPGEFLALVNSFGVLEIARAEASAADGLGLGRGAPIRVLNATR